MGRLCSNKMLFTKSGSKPDLASRSGLRQEGRWRLIQVFMDQNWSGLYLLHWLNKPELGHMSLPNQGSSYVSVKKKKKRKPGLMNTPTHFHFPVEKRPSVKELAVNKLLKMADKHLGMFVFGKLYTDAKGITLQIVGLTTQQISRYRWCSTASDL